MTLEGRASAYGASATATGRVTLPEGREALAYDLRGRAQHVDLRRLPRNLDIPPAATDVNAEYHVVGTATSASVGSGSSHAGDTFTVISVTQPATALPSQMSRAAPGSWSISRSPAMALTSQPPRATSGSTST